MLVLGKLYVLQEVKKVAHIHAQHLMDSLASYFNIQGLLSQTASAA